MFFFNDEYEDMNFFMESNDPIEMFKDYFEKAIKLSTSNNHMVLSTVSKDNMVSSRIVLLKAILDKNFLFFTNYESAKAEDIMDNPQVSLLFFWKELQMQVAIKGDCRYSSKKVSNEYFSQRSRNRQIAAVVSRQSREIQSREKLEESYEVAKKKHEGQEITRPHFWGGVEVFPNVIEFWIGMKSRLNKRVEYTRDRNTWKKRYLSP